MIIVIITHIKDGCRHFLLQQRHLHVAKLRHFIIAETDESKALRVVDVAVRGKVELLLQLLQTKVLRHTQSRVTRCWLYIDIYSYSLTLRIL